MATTTQINNYIDTIGPLAQAEYRRRREAGQPWVLPSVCIAMGAYETGWGTAGYYTSKHGVFNISYPGGRSIGYYNADGGAKYRAYASYADAVSDFYDLICGSDRYRAARNNADPFNALEGIRNGGYSAKWTTEGTNSRVAGIKRHNLSRFDTYDNDKQNTANNNSLFVINNIRAAAKDNKKALIIGGVCLGLAAIAVAIIMYKRKK